MNEFGQVPAPPNLDVDLGTMRTAALNAIGGGAPDPALTGLITQLMQIIIAGQADVGATPKTVMRLALGRTDMKAAFTTLPPAIRGPFEANPATFVTLVLNAVNNYPGVAVANATPVISGALFSDHQYAGDSRYRTPSPFTRLTCDQWLTNIATPGGQDMLSQGNYPVRTNWLGQENTTDREANKLLGSMGTLHNALDPGNRPIFEIRSSKQIHASLITPYALDFFKYVRYLHNPAALTESRELTGLAFVDVGAIVGYDVLGRLPLLQQMVSRALVNFNA